MTAMPSYRFLLIANLLLIGGIVLFAVTAFQGGGGSGFTLPEEQSVKSISLNKDFYFCDEKFPLDNWDVRQRLDAELLRNVYFHSSTILAIKRAHALFPIIEPILREEGVPEDLKYLAVAESTLSNAISPAGAKGVWQFMNGTGQQFGMEINSEVDERYDLEKATRAACRYLRNERQRLGSWVLAAAAYNGGPDRIRTEVEKQRAKSFFDLNLAADETMRYPFRIVAIKEVMQNPTLYEYTIEPDHLYPPMTEFRTVTVDGPVPNWGDFAVQHGTSYRMLKLYNPWLIASSLTNRARKTYTIRLPK
jgi:membrane-bound lytic murein transglycosylase D